MHNSVIPVKRLGNWKDHFFLPSIFKGFLLTSRHFFANLFGHQKSVTICYPEKKRKVAERWRGRHRLTLREDGFIQCVACYLCETICPAHCIHIEAAESVHDKSAEKYPRVFDIDELRCVFCGLCVEACPKDAIRMDSGIISLVSTERAGFEYTRNLLMDGMEKKNPQKYSEVPLPKDEKEALPRSKGIIFHLPKS